MSEEKTHEYSVEEVSSIRFPVSDCPVTSVTVFTDRAEVTREVEIECERAGQHEVWIQGLTSYMNEDSVRVKGVGLFEIQEVSFDIHYVKKEDEQEFKDEDSRKSAIRGLQDQIQLLDDERISEEAQIDRNRTQLELLNSYAEGMMSSVPSSSSSSSPSGPPVASIAKDGDLSYVNSVLDFYETRRATIDGSIRDSNKRIVDINKERHDLNMELQKLRSGGPSEKLPSRDVTVVLNVQDASSPVTLFLTYLVSNASWTPSYDVRISSEDNSMALTYFGRVKQSTGENWNACDIALSTATPSLGGTPPELPQKQIRIKPKYQYNSMPQGRGGGGIRAMQAPMHSQMRMMHTNMIAMSEQAFGGMPFEEAEEEVALMDEAPGASVSTASVQKSGAGAATFTIPRKASIESDNKPHKLTIAVIDLAPHFMYYTAPGLSPHAYLQTRTPNTSDYPFLASEQVSVFFDGNFVTTSSMKHVSPGESFHSFLGVDSSVKVDYRPVRQTRGSSGVWTRTSTVQYDHRTVVTNNKQHPIEIIVAKVFPRSSDDRIKIRLIEPSQESVTAQESKMSQASQGSVNDVEIANVIAESGERHVDSIMHNPLTNNMVWARTIEAGAKQDFIFSYNISYPGEEDIEVIDA